MQSLSAAALMQQQEAEQLRCISQHLVSRRQLPGCSHQMLEVLKPSTMDEAVEQLLALIPCYFEQCELPACLPPFAWLLPEKVGRTCCTPALRLTGAKMFNARGSFSSVVRQPSSSPSVTAAASRFALPAEPPVFKYQPVVYDGRAPHMLPEVRLVEGFRADPSLENALRDGHRLHQQQQEEVRPLVAR
jgi:hypothetical protein